VTSEDQVVALFAKANPVPSLDLLDPIEPMDIDLLMDEFERKSGMTAVHDSATRRSGAGSRLTLILAALGAIVVAVPLLIGGVASVDDSPESLGDRYMSALGEYDWDAIRELFDPEEIDRAIAVTVGRDSWEYQQAVGMVYQNLGCAQTSSGSGGTVIECAMLFDSKVGRVLGLEPVEGLVSILASEGHVRRATHSVAGDNTARPGLYDQAWDEFRAWVGTNHAEEVDSMYDRARSSPKLGPESTALWEQYTDEFVAEMGG
jgi:hypothetical protein